MMEPFKISLHELITIGAIVISVTTAYVLLNADVKAIQKDVVELKVGIDEVQKEQFRVNFMLGRREGLDMSDEDKRKLREGLDRKPWRMK